MIYQEDNCKISPQLFAHSTAHHVWARGDHHHVGTEAAAKDVGGLHLLLRPHWLPADQRVHQSPQTATCGMRRKQCGEIHSSLDSSFFCPLHKMLHMFNFRSWYMGSRMRWRAWKPRWSESTRITTRFTSKSTTLATLRLSRWTSEERSWLRCSTLFVISSRWIVRMLFNDTVKNDKSTENGYTSLLRWWAHWLIRSVFRVKGYQAYWWRRISTTTSSIPLTFPVSSLSLSPDGEQGHQGILVALMLHDSVIVLGYLASKLNQSRLWMNEWNIPPLGAVLTWSVCSAAYTELAMSTVKQTQAIPFTGPYSLLVCHLRNLTGKTAWPFLWESRWPSLQTVDCLRPSKLIKRNKKTQLPTLLQFDTYCNLLSFVSVWVIFTP